MGKPKGRTGKALSTSAAARHTGVSRASVANWIDRGLLKAGRTPGGHRRIEVRDLLEFLQKQGLLIPPELERPVPRIMVVIRQPHIRNWITKKLRERRPSCEFKIARDGFEAGQLMGSWRPDVVLLDLLMDGASGLEICRRIKAKAETSNIEVIALSPDTSPDVRGRARQCGARACLRNPPELESLLRELDAAL